MPLAAGRRLGPYQIEAPLGAGGMGEIYRALDTRLSRPVAVKILPARLAADSELRERFEREARTVAALSHPHICTLYDVGRDDDVDYLVMEYVEGETLAARLARRPAGSSPSAAALAAESTSARGSRVGLPLDQVLRHATEIADALDKAHRRGIIHRDIKPANIMITRSGVKLLDFGLAKVAAPVPVARPPGGSELPTAPSLTGEGAVLGTLNYMPPEQLEGREADARSDIFALAAVTYEMATGRRPFEGKSHAGLIAAILEHDPVPLGDLVPSAPPALDRLVMQCLAKDPDDRWQSAGDVRRELEGIALGASQAGRTAAVGPGRSRRARAAWALGAVAGLALAAAIAWQARRGPAPAPTQRWHLQLWHDGLREPSSLAVSRDGRQVAFIAAGAEGKDQIFVRPLEAAAASPLGGTEGARHPIFSPDGRQIAFAADGKLKRVRVDGGQAQVLCDAPGAFWGGSWGDDGTILFATSPGDIRRVSELGGSPAPVLPPDVARPMRPVKPTLLPDGKRFLFLDAALGKRDKQVRLGFLDGRPPVTLLTAASYATYAQGYLLFMRAGALLAQPFDPERAAVSGEPMPVAEDVFLSPRSGLAAVAASRDGPLVYREASGAREQLVWFDRGGARLGVVGEVGRHDNFDLSPDGQRVVYAALDARTSAATLWVLDLQRNVTTLIPTAADADVNDPVWAPDGQHVAYTMRAPRVAIMKQPVSGGEATVLYERPGAVVVMEDWSRDGKLIAINVPQAGATDPPSAYLVPVGGAGAARLGEHARDIDEPHFSPDGRWIAYNAVETDRWAVFVTTVPPGGERWQVSTEGGVQPRWRGDGKQLYYLSLDGTMMAVDLSFARGVQASPPRPLFKTPLHPSGNLDQYAVTPDGQRFLVNVPLDPPDTKPLHVVMGWAAALGRGR